MKLMPFEGARAKLERAKHHLKELEPELRQVGVTFGAKLSREGGEIVARASLPRDLFIRFAVLTGEIVHQTRSALDHALMDCRQDNEAMRVFDTPGPNFQKDPLYTLTGLWNKEKHKLLNLAVFYPYGVQLTLKRSVLTREFPDTFTHKMFQLDVLAEDGEELFREPDPGQDVEAYITLAYAGVALEGAEPIDVPLMLPGETEPRGYTQEVPELGKVLRGFIQLAEQTIDHAAEIVGSKT